MGRWFSEAPQREHRRLQPGYGSPSGQRVPPGSRLRGPF
uniref:Rho/Rac guanine nucleotide exchange factor 18 n=1 Tax=Mus musculus TaxID=10090 RepID=A0A140LHF8_MOUSE